MGLFPVNPLTELTHGFLDRKPKKQLQAFYWVHNNHDEIYIDITPIK
jgi:hypothetical protein